MNNNYQHTHIHNKAKINVRLMQIWQKKYKNYFCKINFFF